jgi:UDP-N-acetylglucosamine--N-acetylmuramyl-(pentapeptide) pyrophosphoryl-undecaprenol N-acetylglucosamine transferase
LRVGNILFPVKLIVSLIQSFFLIRKFRPNIALGTGGYVCGPLLYVASVLGIPIVVHESNSYPGITARILSRRATCIFTAFEETARWLRRKDNIRNLGTPTRDALGTVTQKESLRFFKLDPSKKTVLVFGGSLGASSINEAIKYSAGHLASAGFQLIWQTGSTDRPLKYEMTGMKNCWIDTFIDKMEYAYAAADIVVCRAGATTVAELTRLGKAAILVPYPHAAADHQTFNARTLADAGAAVMVADKDVKENLFKEIVGLISNNTKLKQMSEFSLKLGKPDAGKEIAGQILELAK